MRLGESGVATSLESWPIILNLRVLSTALLMVLLTYGGMARGQGQKLPRSAEQKSNADREQARRVFATNCAGCHGLDGKGGERAPDIVSRPNVRGLSDAQLLQILQEGIPQASMPAFTRLGDDILRSLVAHLRSLQGNSTTASVPGNARRGRELFFGKGECSACHMVLGQGGFFASDLTAYARGRASETIRDAIVLPNRDLDPRNRMVVVTLHTGKTYEGMARNEDNFSMQLLTRDGSLVLFAKAAVKSLSYGNQSPMPADYGTRLSKAEIEDLVNFLNSVTKEDSKPAQDQEKDDGE